MIRARSLLVLATIGLSAPLHAQLFWQPPQFAGAPIADGEADIGVPLPGATPEEYRASVAWQLRSGLNVMALQCQFDKTLLTENSYNTILTNHGAELKAAYAQLAAYFKRTTKSAKAAQNALDAYGTRTYSGFSTVRAQLGFCQTASRIARSAAFAPRGNFTAIAVERLRELRGSLVPAGEQQFRFPAPRVANVQPDLSGKCWTGRGTYKPKCPMVIF